MLKFQKTSPFVRFEKLTDFAKESQIMFFQGYYMKPAEIRGDKNIPLYVMQEEQVTIIYYLTISASNWVRENLEYNGDEKQVFLKEEFMYKFDLVRVIPEGGLKPTHSFLRVMLKSVPENAELFSIEEEIYGLNWQQGNV